MCAVAKDSLNSCDRCIYFENKIHTFQQNNFKKTFVKILLNSTFQVFAILDHIQMLLHF